MLIIYNSQYDVFMGFYLAEMESVVVTYGDTELNISGKNILDYLETRIIQ